MPLHNIQIPEAWIFPFQQQAQIGWNSFMQTIYQNILLQNNMYSIYTLTTRAHMYNGDANTCVFSWTYYNSRRQKTKLFKVKILLNTINRDI